MNRLTSHTSAVRLVQMLAQVVLVAALVNLAPQRAGAEAERPVRIVALGDSLTAGLGISAHDSFPEQLQRALAAKGIAVELTNSGVSGDTSGSALQRLDWAVPAGADAAIVELGANDALRGIDPKLTRAALEKIVARLKAKGLAVLIAGMRAPRNWGDAYAEEFDRIYPEVANSSGSLLYPFFLDGVALSTELNQPDGLHPTGKGVAEIVKRILPKVEELIAQARKREKAASKG